MSKDYLDKWEERAKQNTKIIEQQQAKTKMSKRFQECNWVEKLWRYRYYMSIPFKWVWFVCIKPFTIKETKLNDESGFVEGTGEIYNPKGKELWGILIGDTQIKMNWVWTSDEVFSRIKDKPKQRR